VKKVIVVVVVVVVLVVVVVVVVVVVTSFSQLWLRPWAFSTHQLATSWLILEGGSPSILGRLERSAIYFNGFLFWCCDFYAPSEVKYRGSNSNNNNKK